MLESASIARRTGEATEGSYERLRSEGIRLVQELSGRIWTDYNLHDPGVTTLEQLCYALTDLIYRADFEIADYLTGERGQIDFEQLALYPPETIFPSRAITINDYRRLIFDAVPEIDNVWIHTVPDGPGQGLYRIHAQLAQWVEEQETPGTGDDVIENIKAIYSSHRNLCEDLEEVRLVRHSYYSLHGSIAVDSQPGPEEILGEIYFRAAQFVSLSLPYHSYAQVAGQGRSLEEIFTGPLTKNVYVAEEDLVQNRESVTISDLIDVIGSIAGVSQIERLWLEDDQGGQVTSIPYDPSLESFPRLRMPSNAGEVGVILRRSDREYQVPFREVEHAIDRHFSEYRSRRQTPQNFSDIYSLPRGEFREVRSYYSVQYHFPNTYGINQFGIPDSEPPRRKSQARNFKAYLLFFEQLLANSLENLQELPRLFSLDQDLRQSYFYQELNNKNSPNVEELYQETSHPLVGALATIVGKFDNFGDRRNRILDYLLGIYGETFSNEALSRFNVYDEDSLETALIQSKIDLLKLIGEPE